MLRVFFKFLSIPLDFCSPIQFCSSILIYILAMQILSCPTFPKLYHCSSSLTCSLPASPLLSLFESYQGTDKQEEQGPCKASVVTEAELKGRPQS